MKTKITQLSLAMLVAGISGMSAHAADSAIESANVLEFNDKSVLFVGDSQGGNIVAYETMAAKNPKKGMAYGLFDFSADIEKLLGVKNGDYLIKDLAVHPESNEAYIALSVIEDGKYQPKIVIANQAGDVRLMDLGRKHTTLNVKHAPAESFMFYDKVNGRSLTFTDIEYHKGKLYISGLSNQDFKSSLRVADYPFTGKASFTSVEIYHAVHNQNETRAPIRTLTIANFNGEDHIVAAYTCTPLVTIPLSALKDGKHVVGKQESIGADIGQDYARIFLQPLSRQREFFRCQVIGNEIHFISAGTQGIPQSINPLFVDRSCKTVEAFYMSGVTHPGFTGY